VPHDYVANSSFEPHIHWTPKNSGTGVVAWGLEYNLATIGGTFSQAGTLFANSQYPASTGGTLIANRHYMTEFGHISGAGLGISWILNARVFRDATGAGTADTYASDAYGLSFDVHYLSDGQGSREDTVK
jgi:hypothetical protein